MKKMIFGLALMLLGGLSSVTLLAGAMQTIPEDMGYYYSVWMALGRYHLTALFWVMAAVGAAGLLLAVSALMKKE